MVEKVEECQLTTLSPCDGMKFVSRHNFTLPEVLADTKQAAGMHARGIGLPEGSSIGGGGGGGVPRKVVHHAAVYPAAQGAWGGRSRSRRDPKSVSKRPSEGASGGEAEQGV